MLKFLEAGLKEGCEVKALFVPKIQLSSTRLKRFDELAKTHGCKGLLWISSLKEGLKSPLEKWTSPEKLKELFYESGGEGIGVCFLSAGKSSIINSFLASLISRFGKEENLIQKDKTQFVWITDFPLLEFDSQKKILVLSTSSLYKPSKGKS